MASIEVIVYNIIDNIYSIMDICPPRMPMHWFLLVRWQLEKSGKGAQWLQQLLAEQRSADEEYIDEAITEGSEAEDIAMLK